MFSKRQLFLRLMRKLQKKYLHMHCDRNSDSLSTSTTENKQTNQKIPAFNHTFSSWLHFVV